MIATTTMTDGRNPYFGYMTDRRTLAFADPFGNHDMLVSFTGPPIIIYRGSSSATGHNLTYVGPSPSEERAKALSHKQWVSWCNMLDRMDEQRHARGDELRRLPDSKAIAPKRRAPSVGRVCSGSSRYRVMSPCG